MCGGRRPPLPARDAERPATANGFDRPMASIAQQRAVSWNRSHPASAASSETAAGGKGPFPPATLPERQRGSAAALPAGIGGPTLAIDKLAVPEELQRNAPRVRERGADYTGEVLIRLATQRCGLDSLAESDVLDVGCGVRFTQALINRRIPFKSYSGVEVYRPIVEFLKTSVEPHDPRFRYEYWNVRNARYNQDGGAMAAEASLPMPGTFDVAWLFSVFTHLDPEDTAAMLRLVRGKMRPGGRLMFSALIDESVDGFRDAVPDSPLLRAVYHPRLMRELVTRSGWRIVSEHAPDPEYFVQASFVCALAS